MNELFFIWLLLSLVLANATLQTYNIAIVAPVSGQYVNNLTQYRYGETIVQLALQAVNQRILNPLGAQLVAYEADTRGDQHSFAMIEAIAATSVCDPLALPPYFVVGDFYSSATAVNAPLMTSLQIPQLGWYSTSSAFSDKTQFPLFSRLVPSDAYQGKALAQLLLSLSVRRVAIVAENTVYGTSITQTFIQACNQLGINVLFSVYLGADASPTVIQQQVTNQIRKFDVHYILLASATYNMAERVLEEATTEGLVDDAHVWLGSDGIMYWTALPVGSMTTLPYQNVSSEFVQLVNRQPNIYSDINNGGELDYYSVLYDDIFAIGYAASWLQQIIHSCNHTGSPDTQTLCTLDSNVCWRNTSTTCQQWAAACASPSTMRSFCSPILPPVTQTSATAQRLMLSDLVRLVRFHGASGWVEMDANGDGLALYQVYNQVSFVTYSYMIQSYNDPSLDPVGIIAPATGQVTWQQSLIFPDGSHVPPPDRRGTVPGQTVANVPDSSMLTLAIGLAFIGAEVALIMYDQAISTRLSPNARVAFVWYEKPEWIISGWLLLAALTMTLAVWSSDLVLLSSIRMPSLPDADNTISYATAPTFAVFPFLCPLMFLVMRFALHPLQRNSATGSSSSGSGSTSGSGSGSTPGSAIHEEKRMTQPISAKSVVAIYGKSRVCFHWNKNHGKLYTVCAAVILTAAIILHHELVFGLAIISPCSTKTHISTVIGGVVASFLLSTVATGMYTFFNKMQLRFISAIVMAFAIWIYQFLSMTAIQYTYTAQRAEWTSTQPGTLLALVATVVCVVVCAALLVFNSSALVVSRNAYDVLAAKNQLKVIALKNLLHRERMESDYILQSIHLHGVPSALAILFEHYMKSLDIPDINAFLVTASVTGTSTKFTMDDVINCPAALQLFRIGTVRRVCDENVGFIKAVDCYSSAPDELRPKLMQAIVDHYIREDGNQPINISGNVRKEVMKRVEAKTFRTDVFEPARIKIMAFELGEDAWTKFMTLNTSEYEAARAVVAAERARKSALKALRQKEQQTTQEWDVTDQDALQLTRIHVKSMRSQSTAAGGGSEPQSPQPKTAPTPIVSPPGFVETL